ncbi:MAG: hypothetical protein COA99_10560 [Moraxellaceae bacterium]|nr:MAG: hypothetical protein COA99_10560 [Moraxellaceae bacterium]
MNLRIVKPASIIALLLASAAVTAAPQDEWKFGVATGLFGLNIEADAGFNAAGVPVETEVDLDFKDILDFKETAGGLSGFAAKGPWRFSLAASVLELTGDVDGVVGPSNLPATFDLTFKSTGANMAASYRFAVKGKNVWSVYGGARYTKHEVDFELEVGPSSAGKEIEESWTDIYVGLSHAYIVNSAVIVASKADVGGGGSDLSWTVNSAIAWKFHKNWTTAFYGQYYSVKFENGDENDSDWYLFDANEFGVGLGITFAW